jgi:hypothetical protein
MTTREMKDIIYYVQAYRVVKDNPLLENHSYVVGVFTDSLHAEKVAREEELERAGKYQCVVYQGIMNVNLGMYDL